VQVTFCPLLEVDPDVINEKARAAGIPDQSGRMNFKGHAAVRNNVKVRQDHRDDGTGPQAILVLALVGNP